MGLIARVNRDRAYKEELGETGFIKVREAEIITVLANSKESLTNREIANRMGYTGFYAPNAVKPRTSTMEKQYKILKEAGTKKDEVTGKNVTTYRLNDNRQELEEIKEMFQKSKRFTNLIDLIMRLLAGERI